MDTKIKLLIFLLFTCLSVFGQEPPLNLAVRLQITSAVGSDPYTVTGIVSDDLSRFIADDIQVGDSLYVLDGSFVYVLGITSITSVVGPTIVFVANDPNDAGISLPTGQAAIIRPTLNYKLPTYISGLRDDLRSAIMNRQAQLIDNISGGGVASITDFISAGAGVPPSASAAANGGETWRNMTTGELWGSNGSIWYPYTRGPKECQDTVLVSAITVQSGGSLTTGSPLVRNSSGVWQHMYNHPSGLNLIPDGVVVDVITGPKAIIQYCGVRKGSGATPNTSYYVDQTVSTGFTTTKPSTNIRPLGKIASNGDFLVNAGLLFSRDNSPSIPLNQIVYGTGSGVDSSPNFKKNGDTIAINTGNLLIRPTANTTQYYPISIWPKKNNGVSANMGIMRIPMDSIAARANSDPYHGNFPAWIKSFSWDNSINVPAGNPLDTTGNLIVNEGFNYDQSDPTYNPKFPKFYWSTEMKYRSGSNSKSWVESHWEFVDTLGRVARPITTAYSYDGSYADLSITSDYKAWLKGASQKALTPGVDYWENTNFTTGAQSINYNLSQSIAKRYSGNLIQKFKNKGPSGINMNIIRHEANDVVQVGDSAGVRIVNDLYFAANNSNPAKVKTQQTVLRFDSMLVEYVSQPSVFRNHRYLAPGVANSGVLLFDGNNVFWGKYAANENIFGININAPQNSLYVTSAGKLAYNASSSFADFDLQQRTDAFGGGLRLLNVAGTYTTLRTNSAGQLAIAGNGTALSEKVIATTSQDINFEGTTTAPPGSIGMQGGSGNGFLWIKTSGTGNTGWVKAVTTTGSSTSIATMMREESFTSTSGQTAFTIAYSAPAVSGTSVPIRVYRNGVRLFYVASAPTTTQFTYSGTTVTTAANTTGDIITIEYLN